MYTTGSQGSQRSGSGQNSSLLGAYNNDDEGTNTADYIGLITVGPTTRHTSTKYYHY